MANKVSIKTPHAAVVVWNYKERLGSDTTQKGDVNSVEPVIISTVSLRDISTSKSKGSPVGSFNLTLAPTKNWVATITPGSWLCILMSQTPITKEDLPGNGVAKPEHVKMIGKIESVRVQVNPNQETGARETTYQVTGVDWGYIFQNKIYIDPFIAPGKNTIGNATYIELLKLMNDEDGYPSVLTVDKMIEGLVKVIGDSLSEGFEVAGGDINRIAKATYSFAIPRPMVKYLQLSKDGQVSSSENVVDMLNFFKGKLEKYDDPNAPNNINPYKPLSESSGYINPISLKGTNSLWQVMVDNSSPVVNETLTDMRWNPNGTIALSVYNRIKPFIFRNSDVSQSKLQSNISKNDFTGGLKSPTAAKYQEKTVAKIRDEVKRIISEFKNVRRHKIPLEDIITVDAGTNWRDKYNFVEIKPSFQDFQVLGAWVKSIAQTADTEAFSREGFRPLIVSTKQWPRNAVEFKSKNSLHADLSQLAGWKELLKIWYFDIHKMLNGTINISGQNEFIGVGDNIMFNLKALGITQNINSTSNSSTKDIYLLAHVENVSHKFTVNADSGARTYSTSIQFVRGIVVSENGETLGEGTLDSNATTLSPPQDANRVNTFGTSTAADPDSEKLKGS